jgi:hypothetical protein
MELTLLVAALVLAAPQAKAALDPARIEELTGAKGALDANEGVFKVSVPRTDLNVNAGGVHITPPLGLTSWAAFQAIPEGEVMVMGDMVVLEDQVNPVMSTALDNGLEVTALHNHFFWDTPKVMFMHIGGMGTTDGMATAVGKVFARIKETSGGAGETPKADIDPAKSSLTTATIDAALGHKGDLGNGVYKVTQAVVDGDFAALEGELQGVLKALRHAGINVVAIHQHMSGDEPRMVFLHYWGIGPVASLAHGLRSALDLTTAPAKPR